jgi:hypothetical protein
VNAVTIFKTSRKAARNPWLGVSDRLMSETIIAGNNKQYVVIARPNVLHFRGEIVPKLPPRVVTV